MRPILLVFAHPYRNRSRANGALLAAVEGLESVTVDALYDKYPGFDVDAEAEQELLVGADVIVWQHPLYWYSVPGLMKHWFDRVLTRGFAYGNGGTALHGKRCLWVTTTGGDDHAFSESGMHAHPFASFVPQIEQTARFCGMLWEEPFVVHAAPRLSHAALEERARTYRERLEALAREEVPS